MSSSTRPYPTVSAVIAALEAVLREHGDLPVLTRDGGEILEAQVSVDRVIAMGTVPTGWGQRLRWRCPRSDEAGTRAVIL